MKMIKFKPKVGQEISMLKENRPLNLKVGDVYGIIKDITDTDYVVKRFDGEIKKYSKDNENEVFYVWFDDANASLNKGKKKVKNKNN